MDLPPQASGSSPQPLQPSNPDLDLFALEAELDEARVELAQYQSLLQDLPAIYEEKFRQKVRATAQDIRLLLDERKALEGQVSRGLVQRRDPAQLAAGTDDAPVDPLPQKSGLEASLPTFIPRSQVPPSFRKSFVVPQNSWKPLLRQAWPWILAAAGLVVSLVFLVQFVLFRARQVEPASAPQTQIKRNVPPSSSTLKLLARGGQSWILIESLTGEIIMDEVLGDGDTKSVNIGRGLRIRSGRPDLLYYSTSSSPLRRLGGVSDLDWTEISQPR